MSGELSNFEHNLPAQNDSYRTFSQRRSQNKALATIEDAAERQALRDFKNAQLAEARRAYDTVLAKRKSQADRDIADHMKGLLIEGDKVTEQLLAMTDGSPATELRLRSLDDAVNRGYEIRLFRRAVED